MNRNQTKKLSHFLEAEKDTAKAAPTVLLRRKSPALADLVAKVVADLCEE